MEDFIGKYNGGQIESRLDKVKDMVGGNADYGSDADLANVLTHIAPSAAHRYLGSRLCFFPEYRKTSA